MTTQITRTLPWVCQNWDIAYQSRCVNVFRTIFHFSRPLQHRKAFGDMQCSARAGIPYMTQWTSEFRTNKNSFKSLNVYPTAHTRFVFRFVRSSPRPCACSAPAHLRHPCPTQLRQVCLQDLQQRRLLLPFIQACKRQ